LLHDFQKMIFRKAAKEDVPAIVEMLASDFLGKTRERFEMPLPSSYYDFFYRIDADSNQELTVLELDGEIIGTMQLTFIPYLTFCGSMRMLIESVRVKDTMTGKGSRHKDDGVCYRKSKEKKMQDCSAYYRQTTKRCSPLL
jgi:N-acetylglutamate synthase-like GNAT family acetyltransferase